MRKYLIPFVLIASLFGSPALADWTGKDASLATITFKNPGVCTSVVCVPVVQLYDGTNVVTLTTAGADAVSNTLTGVPMYGRNLVYNGTTWDRWMGDLTNGAWVNVKASALPALAATSTKQSDGTQKTQVVDASGNVQPSGDTVARAIFEKVTDGTNTMAVKAASTPPATTDPAAVVGIADGNNVTLGAKADSVCGTATGTCSIAALVKFLNQSASTPLDNSSVKIDTASAATAQLVAISASTLVRVTSVSVIAGGTGTIKFVYGTGTNCATGTTDLTGAYPLTAQAGLTLGSGIATLFKGAAGNALCITTTGAVQMSGHIGYQQF